MHNQTTGEPWFLLFFWAFCSIATSFLNKKVAGLCSDLWLVLLLQNGVGVIVGVLVFPMLDKDWKDWRTLPFSLYWKTFLLGWLFMGVLWTSLLGLGKGSVSLSVVAKSCMPLIVAILEPMCLPDRKSPMMMFWVIGMSVVAAWLGSLDPTVSYEVILIFLLNLVLASAIAIVERVLVKSYQSTVPPVQVVTLRNIWSLPIAVFFIALNNVFDENNNGDSLVDILTNFEIMIWILISAVFANSLSVSGFVLKSLTTATTIAVMGTASKIISIVLDNLITFRGVYMIPTKLWLAMGAFTFMIIMYSWETTKQRKEPEELPDEITRKKQEKLRSYTSKFATVLVITVVSVLGWLLYQYEEVEIYN